MGLDYSVVAQAIYSVGFFILAGLIALNPEKLTQRLGKILAPMLLTLIALLFFSTLFNPLAPQLVAVQDPYKTSAFFRGFIEGYQTMDTLAALNFGLIIAMNIRAFGVSNENGVVSETMKAGVIAGVLFIIVYSAACLGGASEWCRRALLWQTALRR